MNYFEFKQILDTDPYSKDPKFLAAKKADKRCADAYRKTMKQERIIKAALHIPVPQIDIEHIKFHQAQARQNQFKNNYLAIAASALLIFAASLFFVYDKQSSDLEKFINDALMMEPTVYMSDAEIPHDELAPLFANLDTAIDGNLGKVHFMKLCPTLNGQGARMVFMNELNQAITVLYMPNSPVEQAIDMQMKGLKGKIIALEQGSAAVIAKPHESTVQIEHTLAQALKPMN